MTTDPGDTAGRGLARRLGAVVDDPSGGRAVGPVLRRSLARLGQSLVVVVVATTLNFALPHLAPGDPVEYLYQGAAGSLTAAQVADLRADYGLDQPLPQQYVSYWRDLFHGDLGVSVEHNRPVRDLLVERLPWTVLLVGTATVLAALVGTLAGALAAWRRGSRSDVGLVSGVLTLDAMPGFWIGMVLVAVLAVGQGWFPSFGAMPVGGAEPGLAGVLAVAHHLVLPVATLVLATLGGTFLLARGAMSSALEEPWVRMAEAKGVAPRRVALHHALRNALLPVSTTVALNVAVLLSGSVVIETVFAYPGLGDLVFDATIARDYPLLRGAFLLVTLGVVASNVVVDLAYPLLDPRVRDGRST